MRILKEENNMPSTIIKLIVLLCLSCPFPFTSKGQDKQKKITLEILASALCNSQRFYNLNETDHSYFELRAGYKLDNFFETSVFAGYKLKNFIYFAEKNGNQIPLFMQRHYTPVGINGRIYLSDFFFEKLKLWKKPGQCDVYNQVGLAILKGQDVNDSRDDEFRNNGYYVPFYSYPYVVQYNLCYITYLFGVRYNFSKNFGLFLEGGEGALNNFQVGIAGKF